MNTFMFNITEFIIELVMYGGLLVALWHGYQMVDTYAEKYPKKWEIATYGIAAFGIGRFLILWIS